MLTAEKVVNMTTLTCDISKSPAQRIPTSSRLGSGGSAGSLACFWQHTQKIAAHSNLGMCVSARPGGEGDEEWIGDWVGDWAGDWGKPFSKCLKPPQIVRQENRLGVETQTPLQNGRPTIISILIRNYKSMVAGNTLSKGIATADFSQSSTSYAKRPSLKAVCAENPFRAHTSSLGTLSCPEPRLRFLKGTQPPACQEAVHV